MIRVIADNDKKQSIGVSNLKVVHERFTNWNLTNQEWMAAGHAVHSFKSKFDIDVFFKKVRRRLVPEAMRWLTDEFVKIKGLRRKLICIPDKKNAKLPAMINFSRAFHGHMTNQSKHTIEVRFVKSFNIAYGFCALDCRDIEAFVKLDFETAVLKFGC